MQINNKYGEAWSRNELILALFFYCQIPFKHTKAGNEEVIRLASILRRTPSSVARKLGNFGSFDPLLAQKGIKGLIHVSKGDKEVWEEFFGRWDALVTEASTILSRIDNVSFNDFEEAATDSILAMPQGPSSETRLVEVRRHQSFFRRAVLSSYRFSCCVCGLNVPKMLVASHIVPWSENEHTRADPQNGLCLCALHDRAFDNGFLSIDGELIVHLSSVIRQSESPMLAAYFLDFEKHSMRLPDRFTPNAIYLDWHFKNRLIV